MAFKKAEEDLEEAKLLMKDSDPEIKEMAELEFETSKQRIDDLEIELKRLLLPKDPVSYTHLTLPTILLV